MTLEQLKEEVEKLKLSRRVMRMAIPASIALQSQEDRLSILIPEPGVLEKLSVICSAGNVKLTALDQTINVTPQLSSIYPNTRLSSGVLTVALSGTVGTVVSMVLTFRLGD